MLQDRLGNLRQETVNFEQRVQILNRAHKAGLDRKQILDQCLPKFERIAQDKSQIKERETGIAQVIKIPTLRPGPSSNYGNPVCFGRQLSFFSFSTSTVGLPENRSARQAKKLKLLKDRFQDETARDYRSTTNKLRKIHELLDTKTGCFPVLDDQFVAVQLEREYRSGDSHLALTVPRNGQHRLTIEMWHREKTWSPWRLENGDHTVGQNGTAPEHRHDFWKH